MITRILMVAALVLVIIMLVTAPFIMTEDKNHRVSEVNYNFTIHNIDNHEYIVYKDFDAGGICHKENCKFCMEKLK